MYCKNNPNNWIYNFNNTDVLDFFYVMYTFHVN